MLFTLISINSIVPKRKIGRAARSYYLGLVGWFSIYIKIEESGLDLFYFYFYFLFLEQLGLGLSGHAVISVTT